MAERKKTRRKSRRKSPGSPGASRAPLTPEVRRVTLRPPRLNKFKLPLAALFLVVLVVGLGFQILFVGKKQKIENAGLTRVGSILPKAAYPTLRMAGDEKGNFYRLNHGKDIWEIQKFSPKNSLLAEIQFSPSEGDPAKAVDIAADARGRTYVLLNDGRVRVLDENLSLSRTLALGEIHAAAIELDSKDRIFILNPKAGKVSVFSNEGTPEMAFPSLTDPSQVLSNPVRLAVTGNGTAIVIESHPEGMKAKVFSPKGKLKKTFPISGLGYNQFLFAEVDPKGRIFFNNHYQSGIYFYSSKNGKLLGKATSTVQRDFINHPGGAFVNKWTGDIYVYFAPGFMKCRLIED